MVASYSPIFSETSPATTTAIGRFLQKLLSTSRDQEMASNVDFGDRCPVEQLKTLPSDTFGYQWAIALETISITDESHAEAYVMSGLHLLTGYGNDALGVAELQAFLFGTTGQIMSLVKCLAAIRHEAIGDAGIRLYQAYQRGRSSYFTPSTWQPEALWDLPVQYVQRWLGL